MNEPLPEGWYSVDGHGAKAAAKELVRELHPSHALYGIKVSAIARRQDSDEWLFQLDAERLVQLHLNYAAESTAKWPRASHLCERARMASGSFGCVKHSHQWIQ